MELVKEGGERGSKVGAHDVLVQQGRGGVGQEVKRGRWKRGRGREGCGVGRVVQVAQGMGDGGVVWEIACHELERGGVPREEVVEH